MEGTTNGEHRNFDFLRKLDYEMLDMVGNGATGTVFLVRHIRSGQIAAAKVILNTIDSPETDQRALRESRQRFEHPNIVGLLESRLSEQRWVIVQQYANAGDLGSYLNHHRALSSATATNAAWQLLTGLGHLHQHGVIHRDIKPSNILLHVLQPGAVQVRLSDFGCVKVRDEGSITRVSDRVGSLDYMAPEIREGREADERSDLYAAGLVLSAVVDRCRGADTTLCAAIRSMLDHRRAARPARAEDVLNAIAEGSDRWVDEDTPTPRIFTPTPTPTPTLVAQPEPMMILDAEALITAASAAERLDLIRRELGLSP